VIEILTSLKILTDS